MYELQLCNTVRAIVPASEVGDMAAVVDGNVNEVAKAEQESSKKVQPIRKKA